MIAARVFLALPAASVVCADWLVALSRVQCVHLTFASFVAIKVNIDRQVVELTMGQYTHTDLLCTAVEQIYSGAYLPVEMLEVCTHVDFLQPAVVELAGYAPLAARYLAVDFP